MDISVIIPIYNVEQYLRRCLDSVLRQERISIEVILVDDGSTDTSGKICDEYAVKHENVHCLHVKNGGPATAKNKGYELAKGRYVAFIDSDDEIRSDMFYTMIDLGDANDSDIVCCNYMQVNEDGCTEHLNHTSEEYTLNQSDAIKALLVKDRIYSQCWTKIYRRNMLEEHNIRNPEGLKTDEDFIFNIQAFAVARRVSVVDKPLYIYTHRSSSLSKDYFNKHISKYIDNRILRLEMLEGIIASQHPELTEYSAYHCIFYYNELLGRVCMFPDIYSDSRVTKVVRYIRSHRDVLMRYHSRLGFSKIGAYLILYSPQRAYLYYRKKKCEMA